MSTKNGSTQRRPFIYSSIAAAVGLVTLCRLADAAPATLRLVAADRPDRPLCSRPTNFRYSPFGGLIATNWLSGARVDGREVFRGEEVASKRTPSLPSDPFAAELGDDVLGGLIEELEAEHAATTESERPTRDADRVDPMYRDKFYTELTTHREIGPQVIRHSQTAIELTESSVLQPGDLTLKPDGQHVRAVGGRIEVDCYPVTIGAVREDAPNRRVPFEPELRWAGRDLLAALRSDHSPALPVGPPSDVLDPEGRPRRFFDLTLYLPPTRHANPESTPYTLQGTAFHVGKDGVTLVANPDHVRKTGPFSLQIVLPAEPPKAEPPAVPVYLDAPAGTSLGASEAEPGGWVALDRDQPRVTIRHGVDGRTEGISAMLPGAAAYPNAVAVGKAAAGARGDSTVYVFAAPESASTRGGKLRIQATAWTAGGKQALPDTLGVELEPFPGLVALTGGQGRDSRKPEANSPVHALEGKALPGGDDYAFDTGDVPPGLYRVRFPELFAADAGYDFIVCVADQTTRGAVSLFTHHNRQDYRQGETIEVTALWRGRDAETCPPLHLVVTGDRGDAATVGHVTFDHADTAFVSIPAANLQPGRYLLGVEAADRSILGHRIVLNIFPQELETTWEGFSATICETSPFRTSEGLCSYRLMNSPLATLQDEEERRRYTGQAAMPAYAAALCRADPLFPAPETAKRYDETEQALAAATRFGVQFMPHGTWGLDGQTANWNPMHSYGESLDWMRRMYALRAQIYREFDSFGGFFMNWYPSLGPHYEMHPPRAGFAEYQAAALSKAVREAQGPLPEGWAWSKQDGLHLKQADGTLVKEAEILAAGLDHPLFNAPAMRKLAEWKLRGTRRRTGAFAEAYAAWTAVPRELGDWNYLSFVPVGWFRGTDHYPPVYYSTVPRAGIHAYTDWQVDPFMELFGIDYYGAGSGKPPWVQAMSGWRNMHIRQTFLAAGRGAWGVGLDARELAPSGHEGEEIRLVTDLMHRYGPYFMELKPRSPVAIVRSLHQEAADTGPFRGSGGRNGMIWFGGLQGELWMLYYNLLRSGYPADFITEEEIAAGKLADYQAVFLHRQRLVMPPELMQQFQDYVAGGGRVLRDPSSSPAYPGEEVVVTADPDVETNVGSSSHAIGGRYLWLLHNYFQCKDRLEAVLATLPKPWVRSDHHHIVHTSLAGRDTTALFVINDTMVPPRMHTAAGKWFIQGWTMTRKGRLFFDKPYFVYDVTEGGGETRLIPAEDEPAASRSPAFRSPPITGAYACPVDFLRSEGRILIVTERPLRNLKVTARSIRREGGDGDEVRIDAAVLDDAGKPFHDPLPFELVLSDPNGREVKRLWRACGPRHPIALAMGRNMPGDWTIRARELASGLETTVTLPLGDADAAQPFGVTGRPVLARRPDEIRRFLREKQDITIVLDEGQGKEYRKAAEELAAALRAEGKACDVLELDPVAVCDLPLRWRRNACDQAVWERVTKGEVIAVRRALSTLSSQDWVYYDHPLSGYAQPGPQFAVFRDVILLGAPENNRLIADLHGIVGRAASASCPGAGGALIQVIRDGFAPRHDVLTVQVADRQGLAAGSAWLAKALTADAELPPRATEGPGVSSGPVAKGSLPNVQRDGFGVPVNGLEPLENGKRLLVSLSGAHLSGCTQFRVDVETGAMVERYPGILGGLRPLGERLFLHSWQDRTVFRGPGLDPLWQLRGEGAVTVHPETGDIFVAFEGRILRLDRNADTMWVLDLAADMSREREFLQPLIARVEAVSPDGRHLLVSSYREEMYGSTVAGYVSPTVLLLDTETGKALWRHTGDLVRGTACGFIGDRIVVCNSGDGKRSPTPALTLLNMNGDVIRTMPLQTAIARVRGFGSGGLAVIQEVGGTGVGLLDLNTGTRLDFPVSGHVKGAWGVGDTVVIGTWEKGLYQSDSALRLVMSTQLPSQANIVIANPAGPGLLVGTDSGQVLWLDAAGKVTRTVDFNEFNIAENDEWWVRRFLGENLADISEKRIVPWAGKAVSTLDRAAAHANVSKNLLAGSPLDKGDQPWRLGGERSEVTADIACQPGATYVMSLYQKVDGDMSQAEIRVRVEYGGALPPFEVTLPLSAGWEERTLSFRPPAGAARARITLALRGEPETGSYAAMLNRVTLASVRFLTNNKLFQKLKTEPGVSLDRIDSDEGWGIGDLFSHKPPDVQQSIPWIAHLAAASGAGAKPPPIVTPWTMLVDGKLQGQETSWTGKALPQGIFSDHAELLVTFDKPCRLSLVALYHDPESPARYTRKFAVFARTPDGVKLLGSETNNKSPYSLFAFDEIEVESLVYYWAGSPDGHVRLMEIEAYGNREELW